MYHYAARGNMHKKFGEDRTCSSEDMIVDRQTDRHARTHERTNAHTHARTHTHTHTRTLITILHSPVGGRVITTISKGFHIKYARMQALSSYR